MAINPSEITVADKNRAMYILQNGGNRGDYLVAVLAILTAHIPPTDKMQRSVPCGCKDMTIDDCRAVMNHFLTWHWKSPYRIKHAKYFEKIRRYKSMNGVISLNKYR